MDEQRRFQRAQAVKLRGRLQARETEGWSLKEALLWTSKWRPKKCIFKTNAKIVVDAIHRGGGHTNFHTIIDECVEILKHFGEVFVIFNRRSANRIAHMLARAAFFNVRLYRVVSYYSGNYL